MGLRGVLRSRRGGTQQPSHSFSGGGALPEAPSCDYFASPTGSGVANGLSTSTPFRIDDFFALGQSTIRGKHLCLMNGTYQGSSHMIDPPGGLSGTQALPITIRALNDGQALIDGQFARLPIALNNNDWWIIEGMNAKNGPGNVINIINGSSNNIIRRVVAWDGPWNANNSLLGIHYGSANNLIEDVG